MYNTKGRTPLSECCFLDRPAYYLEKLITSGCNVNSCDSRGLTPLHYASLHGNTQSALLLLENGANINEVDEELLTPLHLNLKTKGDMELVCTLLCHGANPNIEDKSGFTPFMTALQKGYLDLQHTLMDFESDFNRTDDRGYSTLLLALINSSPFVSRILEYDADINYFIESANALELSLQNSEDDIKLIWTKFDSNLMGLVEETCNISLINVLLSRISRLETCLDCLLLLFSSESCADVIENFSRSSAFLPALMDGFASHNKRLDEDQLHVLVCTALSHGASLSSEDLSFVYYKFGYGKLMKLLLHMDLTPSSPYFPSLSDVIIDLKGEVWLNANKEKERPRFLTPKEIQNLHDLLDFCTPSCYLKQFFDNHDPVTSFRHWAELMIEMGDNHEMQVWQRYVRFYKFVTDMFNPTGKKLDVLKVPSLLELARNATRNGVSDRFGVKNAGMLYSVLRKLPVPLGVVQILCYEVPVNKVDAGS